MVTYEQALEKARSMKQNIDTWSECSIAYIFGSTKDGINGSTPCVILKETGEAINMQALLKYPDQETKLSDTTVIPVIHEIEEE